jgi:hypothetical protein
MLSLSVPTPRWKLKSKSDSPAMDSNLTLPHHRRNRAPKTLTGHRFAEPSFTGYNFTERGLTGYNLTGTASRGTASQPPEKIKPTRKPAKARFTPQQVADSPANQTSMQFDSQFTPKYCSCPILKKLSVTAPAAPTGSPPPTAACDVVAIRSHSMMEIQKSIFDSPRWLRT